MPKWRGYRWDRATDAQKRMLLAGISSKYWEPLKTKPQFAIIEAENKKGREVVISPVDQAKWYRRLLEDEDVFLSGLLIGFGSDESDEQAFHLAVDLIRLHVVDDEQASPVKIVDMGQIPPRHEFNKRGDDIGAEWWDQLDEANIVLLYNILGDCSQTRVEKLRDLLKRCPEATRIVVVAGSDPVEFFLEALALKPDVAFHTDGSIQERVVSR